MSIIAAPVIVVAVAAKAFAMPLAFISFATFATLFAAYVLQCCKYVFYTPLVLCCHRIVCGYWW